MNSKNMTFKIEKTINQLAKKGTPSVHLKTDINNIKIDLEFMIEHSKIWVLSHHDRTKMPIDKINTYLSNL